MPNAGPHQVASPDTDLSNKQLAERWRDAAFHTEVWHDDTSLQTFSLVIARDLLAGDRWRIKEIRRELLQRLAEAPYVEDCCKWREAAS